MHELLQTRRQVAASIRSECMRGGRACCRAAGVHTAVAGWLHSVWHCSLPTCNAPPLALLSASLTDTLHPRRIRRRSLFIPIRAATRRTFVPRPAVCGSPSMQLALLCRVAAASHLSHPTHPCAGDGVLPTGAAASAARTRARSPHLRSTLAYCRCATSQARHDPSWHERSGGHRSCTLEEPSQQRP